MPCSAQNQRTKIFTKGQLRRRGKQKETSLVCENVIYKAKKKQKENPFVMEVITQNTSNV